MDTFMQLLLLLLLLLLLPLSLLFLRKKDPKNLPPGSDGWPILGEYAALILVGYQKFITDRMRKYSGEVFRASFTGEKTVVLCGAEGNKFIFANDNKLMTPWLPPSMKKVLLPEFVSTTNCKEPAALFRKISYESLKPEALKQHIAVMDALAREHLDCNWKPKSVVKALPSSKKYIFELVCRVFLNFADQERISRLLDPFTHLGEGMISMPIDFPGTAYHRAVKAGRVARREMLTFVEERRKELIENEDLKGKSVDLLSRVLLLCDEDGNCMSDAKVANFCVSLLMGSYEATAYAATAVIYYLAQLPHIYQEVYKEQMEIANSKGPNELLTWEDTEKMKYTWNVVRETLRLLPPAPGSFREVLTDFTYGGFTIPKGWKTYWTVHSTHKNPDCFPNPEKFDPSRFEGSGPAPYTYVPFGGGPKMCPGRDFAKLALLVLVHNVVSRFRVEKVIPNEKMVFSDRPKPAHGLPLHLHPHQM